MSTPFTAPAHPSWQELARRPLLVCTVCFLLGIVFADQARVGPGWWAGACVLAVVTAAAGSRLRPAAASGMLLAGFVFLGGFAHSVRLVVPPSDISRLQGVEASTIVGRVASPPRGRHGGMTFILRAQTVNGRAVTGRAQASTPRATVTVGQQVLLEGAQIRPVREADSGGEFDYSRWLWRRGIHAQVTAKKLSGEPAQRRPDLMAGIVKAIEDAMPGPEADLYTRLLMGMVYGLEAQPVPESVVDDFRRAGTVHLLVVSGAQVSMLVVGVLWLMGVRWPAARWWHLTPVVIVLAGLVVVAGLGESVARAVAMFALMAWAALSARDYDLSTAVACAALLICIADSNALFSLGFQLTFAATIGVALFLPPGPLLLLNRSPAPASVQALRSALWGTVGAWVMVTPLLAHAFGGFPVVGNIANLVNVPLSGLIMVLGFVALPLALLQSLLPWVVWHGLLVGMCFLARVTLDVIMGVNHLAGALPLAYAENMPLSVLGVALWYGLAAVILITGALARLRQQVDSWLAQIHPAWLPIAGAGLVGLLWLGRALSSLPPGHLQVTFLPVGAGQCAVIRGPSGACLMVDCGGGQRGEGGGEQLYEEVIRPWLTRLQVPRVDLIAVSHWDADHYNALPALLSHRRWGTVVVPPQLHDAQPPPALAAELEGRSAPLIAGGMIHLGGGAQVQVLAPRRPWLTDTGDDANNNSAVLRLVYRQQAVLLPGDLQQEGIKRLTRDALVGRCQLSAQVLCLPHHGRSLPDCLRLVELSRPRWVVASCDRLADRYLDAEAEEELTQRGARLLRTDREGAISFFGDGHTWRVRTWGRGGMQWR